jgi:DNA processing protein
MAHKAALANEGLTVAVLAGGVDRFYPAGHDALLRRIVESGAVVSEVPCGGAPTKWRFLQRNRLIAAMSCATVVVEAGHRSGSLNTAGHASALGRPLGAVPGPVTSPASAGCHRLIRDYAAVCVTNTDEIVELVSGFTAEHADQLRGNDRTQEQTRVVDALSARSARPLENIAARAGMSIAAVRAELGVLELDGVVSERAGGWVRG